MIKFEDPPPAKRAVTVHDWPGISATLRARRGDWALVATCRNQNLASVTARQIRLGIRKELGQGFEATARTVDGEHRVYARYVGDPS